MTFVIVDTNIFLTNPYLLDFIPKNATIIVPKRVFEELDGLKKNTDCRDNAQQSIRNIGEYYNDNKVILSESYLNLLPREYDRSKSDNHILSIAKKHIQDGDQLILLTNDKGLKIKATAEDIVVLDIEEYLNSLNKKNNVNRALNDIFIHHIKSRKIQDVRDTSDHNELDINFVDQEGLTPLIHAVRKKDKMIVSILVNHPLIDLDKRDQWRLKFTPFLHATQNRNIEIMDILRSNGAKIYLGGEGKNSGNNALLVAAWDGSLQVIEYLLSTGEFSINQTENNGFTALIKASIKGHVTIVKYLLKQGADNSIRDRMNKTALDHAIDKGHREIIMLLDGIA